MTRVGLGRVLGIETLRSGAAVLPFDQQITALPGIIAYWPLTDTSGTTATNTSGATALNGTYTNTYTLAGAAFPFGNNVANFGAGYVLLSAADANSSINWSKGWYLGWGKLNTAELTDGGRNSLFQIRRNNEEQVYIQKDTANYSMTLELETGNTRRLSSWYVARDDWMMFALTWDVVVSELKIYIDGTLMQTMTGLGTPLLNATSAPNAFLGQGQDIWRGAHGHHALGAGAVITESQINSIYEAALAGTRQIAYAGDSKTNFNDWWQPLLLTALKTETGDIWRERYRRIAEAGWTSAALLSSINSNLSALVGSPEAVLVNIGANDQSAGTNEATYKANLTGIIDAYRSKTPSAVIYVAIPYREDVATPTSPATMKTWITDVVTGYASANVKLGHDETVWFAGDIATYSDDGAHYNAAGSAEVVNQWMTVMGY